MTHARILDSERPMPISFGAQPIPVRDDEIRGGFVTRLGERFYCIENVQAMPPFFMTVVSESDHWLFVSSTGGLSAGRRNAKQALFPYYTEDKIAESSAHTGPATVLLVTRAGASQLWEPFRPHSALVYRIDRRLYKNVLGDCLVFEETNRDLGVVFSYAWRTSRSHGFVRQVSIENLLAAPMDVRICDGLLNVLPADLNQELQLGYSCLVDAYKMNELADGTTLGIFGLAAQVTDKAEPLEVLRASIVYCLGAQDPVVLLSEPQLDRFRRGLEVAPERRVRGKRGAYLVVQRLSLPGRGSRQWLLVADVQKTQAEIVACAEALTSPEKLRDEVEKDVRAASRRLLSIVARGDGLQRTADESASIHHAANTVFNLMRGGIFAFGHRVPTADFAESVRVHDRLLYASQRSFFESLPDDLERRELQERVGRVGDLQLERLFREYLPLTFSRRHGDPSRPWNRFDIRVLDREGKALIAYEGNWRDVFQNWHALSLSHPEFIEHFVAKFVNASTPDGHNPYHVSNEGIAWELPSPNDPWANIGYWGDHQVVYLLALLELSRRYHPGVLEALLGREVFAYANVPYAIKPYAELRKNPRDSIVFDAEKAAVIERLVARRGSDAKLLLDETGQVYTVNLAEKLLLTVLARMASFVPLGGLWLTTQRPEWNDANNALVGYGLSVVTLCHLERYLRFVIGLLGSAGEARPRISVEIVRFMERVASVLEGSRGMLAAEDVDDADRARMVDALAEAASDYRATVYARGFSSKVTVAPVVLRRFFELCLGFVEHTVRRSRRPDGLYHTYNLLVLSEDGRRMAVEHLYEMLEGQVAALSTLALAPAEVLRTLEALRASRMYRADQHSYTLYPDRDLLGLLDRNVVGADEVERSSLLAEMLARNDERIVLRDSAGSVRFASDLTSIDLCRKRLMELRADTAYARFAADDWARVVGIYELVFHHRAFTGRSGTMFAYEGLGSIYWHMIGKLLVAVQENALVAVEKGASPDVVRELVGFYHAIRAGVAGYNKSPGVYGAFPTDPYSHTPRGGGARQPGMTGQVKEEVITRMGELGVSVQGGVVAFVPRLLRRDELLDRADAFEYVDTGGGERTLSLEAGTLAFTVCQVPVVYHDDARRRIEVALRTGERIDLAGDRLTGPLSQALFSRSGAIVRIDVWTTDYLAV